MVLLTSSAVSVAISGAIICAFTFLLFLSGYVLQQRTVRSLQEALRQPPEALRPIPSLPPQFAKADKVSEHGDEQRIDEVTVTLDGLQEEQEGLLASGIVRVDTSSMIDILQASDALQPTVIPSQSAELPQKPESLAYILT